MATTAEEDVTPAIDHRASSRTALFVAKARASHMLLDGEPKILHDDISLKLLQAPGFKGDSKKWLRSQLRSGVLIRARIAEENMEQFAAAGGTQLVILGAGLDTFAYRQPPWSRERLKIFEVDHPNSQYDKRARLSAAQVPIPSNVEYVSCDFEHTTLADALHSSSLDHSLPCYVLLLGVIPYLTSDAIDILLRTVASLASGSELLMTYMAPFNERSHATMARTERLAEAVGEPWISKHSTDEAMQLLQRHGFVDVRVYGVRAMRKYFFGRADGLREPQTPFLIRAVRR